MKLINKFVLFFLLIVFILSIGVWNFTQSKTFISFVSEKISKQFYRHTKIGLSFTNFSMNVFPLVTSLENTKIQLIKSNNVRKLEFGIIKFEFAPWDVFSSDLSFDKVILADGLVVITSKSKEQSKKFSTEYGREIAKKVLSLINKKSLVSIKRILLKDILFIIDGVKFNVVEGEIKLNKKSPRLILTSYNLDLSRNCKPCSSVGIFKIDEIFLDLTLNKNKLVFNKFKAQKDRDIISGNGNINFNKLVPKIDFKLNHSGPIDGVLTKIVPEFRDVYGVVETKLDFFTNMKNRQVTFETKVLNVIRDNIHLEEVKIQGSLTPENDLLISKFRLLNNNGEIRLQKPTYVMKSGFFQTGKGGFVFDLNKFNTTDLFKLFSVKSKQIKGKLSGHLNINKIKDRYDVILFKNFIIDDFKYMNKSTVIVGVDKLAVLEAEININSGGETNTLVRFKAGDSIFKLEGSFKKNEKQIRITSLNADLKDLGPISGVSLSGAGELNLLIMNKFNVTNLFFGINLKKMSVVKLDLGDVKSQLLYSVAEKKLKILQHEGKLRFGTYLASGDINFIEKIPINLDVRFFKSSLQDTKKIFNKVLFAPQALTELSFVHDSKLKLSGNIIENDYLVSGKTKIYKVKYLKEDVDEVAFNFNYSKKILKISELWGRKKGGHFNGDLMFDLSSKFLEYSWTLKNLKLSDFFWYDILKFGLNGTLSMSSYGSGRIGEFQSRTKIKLHDSYIGSKAISDSNLDIRSEKNKLYLNGFIVKENIKIDSFVNLDKKNSQKSYINMKAKIKDLNLLLGLISLHNLKGGPAKGKVLGTMNCTFDVFNYKTPDLFIKFDELEVSKGNIFLKLLSSNEIVFKSGVIEKFNLNFVDQYGGKVIDGWGEGAIFKKGHIGFDYKINSNVIKLFSERVVDSRGYFSGSMKIIGKNGSFDPHLISTAKGIEVRLKEVPGVFSKINYLLTVDGEKVILQNFSINYDDGRINGNGVITFKLPFPKVNMNLNARNLRIPLLKKSYMTINLNSKISGEELPYGLKGDFSVVQARFADPLSDYYKLRALNNEGVNYLPEQRSQKKYNLLKYSFHVNVLREIIINNTLMNLKLNGGVKITGVDKDAKLNGLLRIVPTESKLKFNGHDFVLKEGKVLLDEKNHKQNINFNLSSVSKISDYKITIDVVGDPQNFSVKYKSEPNLKREDILSLLTIGVTANSSRDLKDSDLESVTTLGISSIIADQLQIDKGIDAPLGLQISVVPDLVSSESSPLQDVSSSTVSQDKVTSSTLLKIKMKLSKKVDLSLSSTLGGSTKQKQKMHLDYNINDNLSVQGVYESKTGETSEVDKANSAGFDFIFRKSFK